MAEGMEAHFAGRRRRAGPAPVRRHHGNDRVAVAHRCNEGAAVPQESSMARVWHGWLIAVLGACALLASGCTTGDGGGSSRPYYRGGGGGGSYTGIGP
jgi:hypothetical protein